MTRFGGTRRARAGAIALVATIVAATTMAVTGGFASADGEIGVVGGRVFIDVDGDGRNTATDPGLEGVRVDLYHAGDLRYTGTTGPGGWWGIYDLPNACYFLGFVPPPGWKASPGRASVPRVSRISSNGHAGMVCLRGDDDTFLAGFVPVDPAEEPDGASEGPTGSNTIFVMLPIERYAPAFEWASNRPAERPDPIAGLRGSEIAVISVVAVR